MKKASDWLSKEYCSAKDRSCDQQQCEIYPAAKTSTSESIWKAPPTEAECIHKPFSCATKRGSRCSTVLSLPRMGARLNITDASDDLTCVLASATSSFTHGSNVLIMIRSRPSGDKAWQKSGDTIFFQ